MDMGDEGLPLSQGVHFYSLAATLADLGVGEGGGRLLMARLENNGSAQRGSFVLSFQLLWWRCGITNNFAKHLL